MRKFLQTENDFGGLIVRLALGIVMLPHGLQKLFGAFGGFGFSGTLDFLVQSGIPSPLAVLVILGESLGSAALILGLFGRFQAGSIALIMLGAIFLVHLKNGFFASGNGIEYHILALGLAFYTVVKGSGAFSIDRLLLSKMKA